MYNFDKISESDRPSEPSELSFQEEKNQFSEKNHLHRVFLLILWAFAISIVFIFLARVYHFIAPQNWHWLTKDQIGDIDRLSVSGVFGALATLVFRRFITHK